MRQPPIKLDWIDRAIEVHRFHIEQLKEEPGWTIAKTADALNRSIGSVSQDILISSWNRTHGKQLRRFNSMREALEFIRNKQREIRLNGVD